jgi:hypothetical protein
VDFIINFSKIVTGVDIGDFNPTTTGVTGATVTNVSGSGSVYTVSVETGSGSGTIRLDLIDNNSIVDTSSNPLSGASTSDGSFYNGETYLVVPFVYKLFLPLVMR